MTASARADGLGRAFFALDRSDRTNRSRRRCAANA
jgi:hypothetical protein